MDLSVLKIILDKCLFLLRFMQILKVFFKKIDVGINNNDVSYKRKYQDHVPCSLLIKLCVINLVTRLCCTEEKMLLINSLNQFLRSTAILEE